MVRRMPSNTPSRLYPAVLFAVMLVLVAVLAVVVLRPFFTAIAWAVVLAVGFQKPFGRLERRLGIRHMGEPSS